MRLKNIVFEINCLEIYRKYCVDQHDNIFENINGRVLKKAAIFFKIIFCIK